MRPSQTLTFNITGNTNPALFSAGPAVAANGTLSFTPAPNANGSATITLTLQDNGGTANGGQDTSAPQTFTITLNSVNDAPSFTKGPDVTVNEDLGAYSAAWATAMSPGPANEASQTLTFIVTNNTNPALFSAGPAVAANGTLTFTPAPNANGSATITLTLRDNGGTANGGQDTSAPQSFSITLNPINDAPVANDASITTNEDTVYNGTLTGSDADGDTLSFAKVTDPAHGTLTVNTNGAFTYTPSANYFGSDSFTFSVSDGHGGSDTGTVNITVNPVNDAPSFTKGTRCERQRRLGRLLSRLGNRHLARPGQ